MYQARCKIYQGFRTADHVMHVSVDGEPLRHPDPERTSWGAGDWSTVLLARAILSDHLGDPEFGLDKLGNGICKSFARDVLPRLHTWGWTLTGTEVEGGLTQARLRPWTAWCPLVDG